jgi:RimJ/RimL family protein N-acetyltransferase
MLELTWQNGDNYHQLQKKMEKMKELKIKQLSGKRIILTLFQEKDLLNPKYLEWLHDKKIIQYLNIPSYLNKPVSFEEIKYYVENLLNSRNHYFFAIKTIKERFIGTFKIGPIDWHAKNANLGILIGDQDFWGKGIGQEAFFIAIKFCFDELGMHKVIGGCMEPNKGMCKIFEKLGFRKEGKFREQDYLDKKYSDHLYYGLLKEEFKNKIK